MRLVTKEIEMEIYKTERGYHLSVDSNITISFDRYEKSGTGVTLYKSNHYAGSLNFDAATEFYKAWRAM